MQTFTILFNEHVQSLNQVCQKLAELLSILFGGVKRGGHIVRFWPYLKLHYYKTKQVNSSIFSLVVVFLPNIKEIISNVKSGLKVKGHEHPSLVFLAFAVKVGKI